MKYSDLLWVQNLALRSCGKPLPNPQAMQTLSQSLQIFLDELCQLVIDYTSYFNELVKTENTDHLCRAFKLGNPKPGMMLLRGKDKMVISAEAGRIRARVVQVHAYNEHQLDLVDFEARVNAENEIIWICTSDNQKVTPELVAKEYFGPFIAHGCKPFIRQARGAGTPEKEISP